MNPILLFQETLSKDKPDLPCMFLLEQNYSNPSNPTTNIGFRIANFGFVTLKVYDVLGKDVKILVNELQKSGIHEVEFNASELSNGVYFYTLIVGSFHQTKKMLVIK